MSYATWFYHHFIHNNNIFLKFSSYVSFFFFFFPSPQKNKKKETKRRKGKEKEKEKPIQRLANRFYRPAYLIIITTTATKRKRKFEKKQNRKNREEKIPPHQESLSRATTAHPAFTHLHASKADPLFYSLPHSLLTCLPASLFAPEK